jgi:hypothetical protein
MGGIFTLGEGIAESVRGEDDAINAGIGGCAAGALAGIKGNVYKMGYENEREN